MKFTTSAAITLLTVALALPVRAAGLPFGSHVVVSLPLSGCKSLPVMNRLAELLLMNDVDAAVKLAIRQGDGCRMFDEGARATAEGSVERHNLVCIRPKGDPDCYWYPANYLGR